MRPSLSSMLGSTGGWRSGSRSATSRRTAFSSTASTTGVFRDDHEPVAQFQIRVRTKPVVVDLEGGVDGGVAAHRHAELGGAGLEPPVGRLVPRRSADA